MELFEFGQENSSLQDPLIPHQGKTKPRIHIKIKHISSNGSVSECNSNRSSSSGTWGMSVTNWAERLVMRGKLTLGSAKPISSFGIYHDHSQFFTGDIDGNVFSWHC